AAAGGSGGAAATPAASGAAGAAGAASNAAPAPAPAHGGHFPDRHQSFRPPHKNPMYTIPQPDYNNKNGPPYNQRPGGPLGQRLQGIQLHRQAGHPRFSQNFVPRPPSN